MTKLYNDHSSLSNFFIILVLYYPVTSMISCTFMLWLIVLLISEMGLLVGVWGHVVVCGRCMWVCVHAKREFLTGGFWMVCWVWWIGVWVKLIVSFTIFVNYMFCYIDYFGILNRKIVVIQLFVFAAMTVFNKRLMKWNQMKCNYAKYA